MGTCVQVYVDAWRRRDKCAHDKQPAILKRKEKNLPRRYMQRGIMMNEEEITIL